MNFKLSKYVVATPEVHVGKEKAVVILFSTRTGEIVRVDSYLYQMLVDNKYLELPTELLDVLIHAEILIANYEDELDVILARNNAAVEDQTHLSYVLQPSAACQLGCEYCGQVHSNNQFDPSLYNLIIDRIEKQFQPNTKSLTICWFGGEPLLAIKSIKEITSRIVQLCDKYNIKYSARIVTNGLALRKEMFLSLVNEYFVRSFEITLDGITEFHDARRYTKKENATFKHIFNNVIAITSVENFDNLGVKITIRSNVDSTNHEGILPLIHLFAAHNLQKKIQFYIAPIHSWGNDAHKISLSKEQFADLEINVLLELLKLKFEGVGFIPKVKNITCIAVTKSGEVIDAFGNIYNCTEIPFVPMYESSAYVLGNVAGAGVSKPRVFKDWFSRIKSDADLLCNSCVMLPVCGGACPKSWVEGNVPCPSSKFNISQKLILGFLKDFNLLNLESDKVS